RVLIYAAEHKSAPKSLQVLPLLNGFTNDIVDGWNHEIGYRLVGDNIIELTSFGEDGVAGGAGESRDYVRRFKLRDENGKWNDPLSDWLPESEVPTNVQ